MDDSCPKCSGSLSTSQTIVPIKKEGRIWYQTQRRCIKCFHVFVVSESLRPPFPPGD